MGLTLDMPPTEWPVTLEEAKEQCSVLHNDHDDMIGKLIPDAIEYFQDELELSIATQTWVLRLDRFADVIELPNGPVQDIYAVSYLDKDGVEQALPTEHYRLEKRAYMPPRHQLIREPSIAWPVTSADSAAVSITYDAGFEALPGRLRRAILLKVQFLYERGADPKVAELLERASNDLIRTYRRVMV